MNGDFIFLILFLVLFIAGGIVRVYYSRKIPDRKRSPRERLRDALKNEGKVGVILLTIQGILLFPFLILYIFFTPWIPWSEFPLPEWLRWFGVGLGIVSLPFLIWTHYTLDKGFSPALGIQEDHTLVTSGPYSRIRHPMYTVHLVYFLAWMLVSANLFFLINYLFTIILIFLRMPKEEQMLLEKFGDRYRDYMQRTGRLLPRFRRGHEE